MRPVEIAKGIYWVGAIDWDIRDFHGYSTPLGTTYNAFLIIDEKVTLIDAVKAEFADELLSRVSYVIDPGKIDYVVSNHTEMDHSGGLPAVMRRVGMEKPLFCSKMGFKNLSMHFEDKFNYSPVEDGGKLNIGKRTLSFLETRMVHWPDSMFTYVDQDNILFSSDGFGQHISSNQRFDDEMNEDIMPHARKYFANILLLYAPLITKLIGKVKGMGISPSMICPDHGIMFRKNPGQILKAYEEWSDQPPKRKALVIYDTMWKSTEKMANAIVDTLSDEDVEAIPVNLKKWHRSDIMTEAMDAGAIVVGSPTLNNGLFPSVSDFLTYMKGLKPKNKIGAAFGSYGWSGESVALINEALEDMKFNVLSPGLKIQYVPKKEGINACTEIAKKIAQSLPAK